MKVGRLATVTAEENHGYVKDFEDLISEESPSLSCPQISSICSQKPILGFVLSDCFGYKKSLSVTRLEAVEHTYNGFWLTARHLNGRYGLGIGSLGNSVEIFLENHNKDRNEYFLRDYTNFEKPKGPRWVVMQKDFRQKTFDLLPESSQKEFETLVK
jgi:hypothetical protein